jgi:RNA polymerase sigma-70 factor (ECF subfamily)
LKHNQVKKQYALYITERENQSVPSEDWHFTETELAGLIEQAMQKLPPRCREAFRLSRFEGKDNASIAQLMGISVRTVELQISKALKIMRIELKDFLPEA